MEEVENFEDEDIMNVNKTIFAMEFADCLIFFLGSSDPANGTKLAAHVNALSSL